MMQQRADWYRFLARIVVLEVDEPLLRNMGMMHFPEDAENVDLRDGYGLIAGYLQGIAFPDQSAVAETITELEVEYARIFLAAGVAQGRVAFPYESVYTSKKHLLSQESCDDVAMIYAAKGLKARPDMYRIPDDHAGLEFEYMQRLCQEAVTALEAGDDAGLADSCREQERFFDEHLKNWVPVFAEDIRKHAQTDFYRGFGRILRGFMDLEAKLMS